MAVTDKTKGRDRASAAFAPACDPMRAALVARVEPPPVPQPSEIGAGGFGAAEEDGLRMIAALESLTSLEPDYSIDLIAEASGTIAEASVTIIEATDDAPADAFEDPPVRLQRPLSLPKDAPIRRPLRSHEAYDGTADFFDEEATVEIVEHPLAFEEVDPPCSRQMPQPASLSERIASVAGRSAGRRFFKALSGG